MSQATVRNHRDLVVWRRAMELTELVYRITGSFPVEERYGLLSQIRKSAVSIPSNIAEGQGRRSTAGFARRLCIAHGSLRELETQLELAARLEFIDPLAFEEAWAIAGEVGRLLNGLIRSPSDPKSSSSGDAEERRS